jgi:phenylalanine-4-hydroxylase
MLLTLEDNLGSLANTLSILGKHGVSLTQIKSKPPKKYEGKKLMNFQIDFEGRFNDSKVKDALAEMQQENLIGWSEMGSVEVPWFPTNMTDFNHIGKRVLSEGDGIQEADHPGFRDEAYKKRRK